MTGGAAPLALTSLRVPLWGDARAASFPASGGLFRRGPASSSLATGLLLACVGNLCAAEIYVSVDVDGSQRYATQAIDPTYRPIDEKEVRSDARTAAGIPERHGAPIGLQSIIEGAANRRGLNPTLVEAVVAIESKANPRAVSRKGAQGAMQLMPATAAQYGLRAPRDLLDPERNIDVGVRHLKALVDLHQGNLVLALAAYNAGRGAVARYGARIPPYPETMIYVAAVLARASAASSNNR